VERGVTENGGTGTSGALYVVSTPIGNMGDFSFRAVETLRAVAAVLAEDTRHTRHLLERYEIETPLVAYHEHNEAKSTPRLVSRLLAGESLAPVMAALAPNLGVAQIDPATISTDPAEVQKYADDPLNYHGKVRARSGAEMIAAAKRVVAGVRKLTLPVLVVHGTGDRLAPPAGSKLVAERIGSVDKTLTLYDGLYHEMFNSPERDQVLDEVVTWLDKHA
jgi:alpha-beta hydrolase superfamily lysophospholipase